MRWACPSSASNVAPDSAARATLSKNDAAGSAARVDVATTSAPCPDATRAWFGPCQEWRGCPRGGVVDAAAMSTAVAPWHHAGNLLVPGSPHACNGRHQFIEHDRLGQIGGVAILHGALHAAALHHGAER